MSANNWAICPRCKKQNNAANAKRIVDIEKQYGKISSVDYLDLVRKDNKVIAIEETLREDYSIYMDEDGEFHIDYSCRCDECDFEFDYNHNESVDMK